MPRKPRTTLPAAVSRPDRRSAGRSTRREFLKGATTVAAGVMAARTAGAEPTGLLPTVALGPSRVTRLIAGGNPLYGYSHFNDQYSQHMLEWFTDERVVEFLLGCEKAGINTWQSSYHERVPRQFPRIRDAGCRMQWICLAAPWDVVRDSPRTPDAILAGMLKCAEIVSKLKPIGIAHHGWATDVLWREGKLDLIRTFVDKVHDLGMPAGISTHNPVILDALEQKGWPNEFYMASFHYLSRRPEEWKQLGIVPVGETYLADDPARMCAAVRQVKKPCLVYKLLAAGRRCGSPAEVRQAFEFAYRNIKPTDAAIVGMYPRYADQIGENTRLVREMASGGPQRARS
jgi:hypothetical protein